MAGALEVPVRHHPTNHTAAPQAQDARSVRPFGRESRKQKRKRESHVGQNRLLNRVQQNKDANNNNPERRSSATRTLTLRSKALSTPSFSRNNFLASGCQWSSLGTSPSTRTLTLIAGSPIASSGMLSNLQCDNFYHWCQRQIPGSSVTDSENVKKCKTLQSQDRALMHCQNLTFTTGLSTASEIKRVLTHLSARIHKSRSRRRERRL